MTQHNDGQPTADPRLASNYAETMERWIAATAETSRLLAAAEGSVWPQSSHRIALHVASSDGELTTIDITDAVNRAHFSVTVQPNGSPRINGVHDALLGNREARLVHRVMLVTCHNPDGSGNMPIVVDPAAARWLSVVAHQEQRQAAEATATNGPAHGTDDTYPYGGNYDEGREYTITCYCGQEFTGELDGTVEADHNEHVDRMSRDQT